MKTKVKTKQTSVAIPIQVKEDAIESLIISALEGGSNYWYRIENKYPLTKERLMDVKKIIRGKAHLVVSEYMQTGKGDESGRLTRASIIAGLSLMAKDYPYHFANLIKDDADAETGDVFFQLAILGDVVYG